MNIIKSFAKLNLYLHVTGKTPDQKYHLLDSLVVFCHNIYDLMTITPSTSLDINITGPYGTYIENNVLEKTLNILAPYLENKNFLISLEKNIPIGAGMGGGSSNAAALVRYLHSQGNIQCSNIELYNLLKSIGTDVPICYQNNAAFFSKTGEEIDNIKTFPKLWAVVLFPEIITLTSSIFSKKFNNYKKKKQRLTNFSYETLVKYLADTENDLYQKFFQEHPEISSWIADMRSQEGCIYSRMTGSGSAIFGLFKTKIQAIKAEEELKKKYNFFIKHSGLF